MKIVIIEDEKAAVRNLTSLLNEIKPNGEIVTILDSISSTIEWFSSHPMPELVFMDIHLADGSAFEIFNHRQPEGQRRICSGSDGRQLCGDVCFYGRSLYAGKSRRCKGYFQQDHRKPHGQCQRRLSR